MARHVFDIFFHLNSRYKKLTKNGALSNSRHPLTMAAMLVSASENKLPDVPLVSRLLQDFCYKDSEWGGTREKKQCACVHSLLPAAKLKKVSSTHKR